MDTSEITKSLIQIINSRLWFMVFVWTVLSSIQMLFYYFFDNIFFTYNPFYIILTLCICTSICLTLYFVFVRQIVSSKKLNDFNTQFISYLTKSFISLLIAMTAFVFFKLRTRYFICLVMVLPTLQFLYALTRLSKESKSILKELL